MLRRAADLLWAAKDLAESGANSQEYEAAAATLRDAARASGDARAEARARTTLAHVHCSSGSRFDAGRPGGGAGDAAGARPPTTRSPAAGRPTSRGIIALYQNRHADGENHLTRAIENFRDARNRPGEASALCNLSRIHLATGRTDSAVALAEQGIGDLRRAWATPCAARTAGTRSAWRSPRAAGSTEATDQLTEALAVFRDSRQRLWEGMTLFRLAEVDLAAGRPAQAATNAEQALTVLRGIGGEWRRGNVLTVLGRALHGIGQTGPRPGLLAGRARHLRELGSPEAARYGSCWRSVRVRATVARGASASGVHHSFIACRQALPVDPSRRGAGGSAEGRIAVG